MINLITFLFRLILFITVLKITIHLLKLLDTRRIERMMPYICGNLGYVISISGVKGSGKTTTAGAIIIYLIIWIRLKLVGIMNKVRKSLPEVDFVQVEQIFMDELLATNVNPDLAMQRVLDNFSFNTLWTDNLHIYLKRDLLRDYMESFWILNFREHYVLSKTYFYDILHGQNARLFDPSGLELRNIEEKSNFQLQKAMVIFDDEKSTGSGNVLSNTKSVKLSGVKDFRGLIRNAYEGLNYEVTTKQIDRDEVKLEREQIEANLNIRKRREINYSFALTKFLKAIYNLLLFPRKFIYFWNFSKGAVLFDNYKKRSNWLRRFENFIFDLENIISSRGYVVCYVRNYKRSDDVGKEDKSLYEQLKLIFPKTYCYATVDTYEWRALARYYEKFSENAVNKKTSCFDAEGKIKIWKESMNRGVDK